MQQPPKGALTLGEATFTVQEQVQERDSTESDWLPTLQAASVPEKGCGGPMQPTPVSAHPRTPKPVLSRTCTFALAEKAMATHFGAWVPGGSETQPEQVAPAVSELVEEALKAMMVVRQRRCASAVKSFRQWKRCHFQNSKFKRGSEKNNGHCWEPSEKSDGKTDNTEQYHGGNENQYKGDKRSGSQIQKTQGWVVGLAEKKGSRVVLAGNGFIVAIFKWINNLKISQF